MSTILINGRPFAAGLYWLERSGPAATARAARRFARPWCVHRAGQTGYAGGAEDDAPEGLPALAPALVDSIESDFWMALVAGDAATGDSTDRGDTGHYALIKVRDGAVLADGDEDGAFGIYAAMVRRLAASWTEPGRRMATPQDCQPALLDEAPDSTGDQGCGPLRPVQCRPWREPLGERSFADAVAYGRAQSGELAAPLPGRSVPGHRGDSSAPRLQPCRPDRR